MSLIFSCNIVSLEESIFSGPVSAVIATGEMGELGIYCHHAPLLTKLIPGTIKIITENEEEEFFYISGGYLEIQPTIVTILSDTVVRAKDISETAARQAQEEARLEIKNKKGEFDYSRAAIKLAQATAKLHTLKELRKKK